LILVSVTGKSELSGVISHEQSTLRQLTAGLSDC